jgi:hypothetical protein
MQQCPRLTIWSGCPAHAKEKTCRRDPRLTIFVRGPTDVDQKVGDPQMPHGDLGMTFDPSDGVCVIARCPPGLQLPPMQICLVFFINLCKHEINVHHDVASVLPVLRQEILSRSREEAQRSAEAVKLQSKASNRHCCLPCALFVTMGKFWRAHCKPTSSLLRAARNRFLHTTYVVCIGRISR